MRNSEAVADLTGGAGDCDANGILHRVMLLVVGRTVGETDRRRPSTEGAGGPANLGPAPRGLRPAAVACATSA